MYLRSSKPVFFKGQLHNQSTLFKFLPAFSPGASPIRMENYQSAWDLGRVYSKILDLSPSVALPLPKFSFALLYQVLLSAHLSREGHSFPLPDWGWLGAPPCKKTTNSPFLPNVERIFWEWALLLLSFCLSLVIFQCLQIVVLMLSEIFYWFNEI